MPCLRLSLVPVVLKSCAEFIETHGIVDGIYRLSGVTSNIQRLRWVPAYRFSPLQLLWDGLGTCTVSSYCSQQSRHQTTAECSHVRHVHGILSNFSSSAPYSSQPYSSLGLHTRASGPFWAVSWWNGDLKQWQILGADWG